MASISILVLITARASTMRGKDHILEHFAEYLVGHSEISGIGKVGGGTHDIGERRALLRENALDFNGRAASTSIVPSTMLPSASLATWPRERK